MLGLLHKNVLEAAEVDRKPIPWCVQADATLGSAGRLAEVKGLMAACLALSPGDRPKLPDLHRSVTVLQAAEAAEARATGGGRPPAATPREWAGRTLLDSMFTRRTLEFPNGCCSPWVLRCGETLCSHGS